MSSENTKTKGLKKELVGIVTSDAMNKTITVSVERLKYHPLYKKGVKRTKKYKAHDEENKAKTGDLVRIRECRPLSKTKRWRLIEIIQSADVLKKKAIDEDLQIDETNELVSSEQPAEE
ncbi:MAG TPA: 30S ribosomal protein S17 [Candidatus Hydrogenedens sp.]|nr:30S ribosomal protein S17 [Candidatus Hydrogenedens sp.]